MRREPTEWEKRLWRHLSNSQVNGYKFRRQEVIGSYICDFFCAPKGLVVEIDGDTHDVERDRRRDASLARKGFMVLRFTNGDVRNNMSGVLEVIAGALATRPDRWTGRPHPNPSPKGEGL